MSDDKVKYLPPVWSYDDEEVFYYDGPSSSPTWWGGGLFPRRFYIGFNMVVWVLVMGIVIVGFVSALAGSWLVGCLVFGAAVVLAVLAVRSDRREVVLQSEEGEGMANPDVTFELRVARDATAMAQTALLHAKEECQSHGLYGEIKELADRAAALADDLDSKLMAMRL